MQNPYFILAVIVASLVLLQVNQRLASPVISIFERWMRWFMFALGAAYICVDFAWINRPYWVLAVAFFLIWFLGVTLYNWLGIHALSVSPLPLFPHYTPNESGAEWPTQMRFLRIRDEVRALGFRQVQALKAEVGGGIFLRVSVCQNAEASTRVQIAFLPQPRGMLTACFSVTTPTAEGGRYVTDNFCIPFAGFYPENWFVERSPWQRSLTRLLARHRRRMEADGEAPAAFTEDPLADLNRQQGELDRLNTEMGFLHEPAEREDFGKITQEGRYRVWKEIWTLNYLGRSARYQ